ncbi:GNAT family N-acetyltransferase [Chengkuizengella axinellae]|uniref:GNAT family N-acetyltransferase n=1 Tax=Chengkuizengella axinellae TaxID=3064388 RepID=A0ABT9IUB6_9BACL|nr:GNAT family N-acetyltransferase [Chengkuizengella sp. 2205SS18-9]MDP5272948.1 GNAT family N-acetyltransferase [Chengkuizengella sp. 2205SS18-9]
MIVKRLNSSNAIEYRELRLEGLLNYPSAFGSSYEEEKESSNEVYENRLASEFITLGAFENGQLTGIVTLVKETKMKLKHRANIYAMYVRSVAHGKGIGKSLMIEAINRAKELDGIEQVYLSVNKDNVAARRLYLSMGFETFGIDKRSLKIEDTYYDEEHMVLFL